MIGSILLANDHQGDTPTSRVTISNAKPYTLGWDLACQRGKASASSTSTTHGVDFTVVPPQKY